MGFTLFKSPDPRDEDLRKEREEASVPWTKSPFRSEQQSTSDGSEGVNFAPLAQDEGNGNRRNSTLSLGAEVLVVDDNEEVEWIDLLLELAMTTAFSSLADNTPVLTGSQAFSYVSYFTIVWWIWASQVAYNMRFRQADWFHRSFAFLQLVVFTGMAAFTNSFDITTGLGSDSSDLFGDSKVAGLDGVDLDQLQAEALREELLPVLNDRGISMVMFSSRILMLLQYLIVYYYARRFRRHAILLHIGAIAFSAMCYLITFLVLGKSSSGGEAPMKAVAKVVLWFTAILIEFVAHFVANELPGRVRYRWDRICSRSSSLFVVTLGVGLDKITNVFHLIVGAVGFGPVTVGESASMAVILIGLFGLYFSAGKSCQGNNHRALTYFSIHLPFMAALIIVLRGVAVIFSAGNLTTAVITLTSAIDQINIVPTNADPCNLDTTSLAAGQKIFRKIGVSIIEFENNYHGICMDAIKEALASGETADTFTLSPNITVRILQLFIDPTQVLYERFESLPEASSPLGIRLNEFQTSPDPRIVNYVTYAELLSDLIESIFKPAFWFMGTAGFVLIMMGVINIIRRTPRDRWEWGSAFSRIFGGVAYASLSVFDINSSRPLFDVSGPDISTSMTIGYTPSIVWNFALSGWLLPSFAFLLVLVNVVNGIMAWFARRAYKGYHPITDTGYGPSEEPKPMDFTIGNKTAIPQRYGDGGIYHVELPYAGRTSSYNSY